MLLMVIRLKKKTNNYRVAVVTGAGSGIGKTVAKALMQIGFHTYLVGRNKTNLSKTKYEVTKQKGYIRCSVFKCDVSNENNVKDLFSDIKNNHERIDLLFNNAGINIPAETIDKIKFKDWKKVIDTNINGMFLCAKYSFQMMKTQKPKGGRIINNGSISAFSPRPKSVAYTTSKHAITGLTKSLSLDGRKYKIISSQIDIGNALTPLTKAFTKGVVQPNGKKIIEPTMNAENVAKLVLLMANLPLDTNILNTTIMANDMPFIGRG